MNLKLQKWGNSQGVRIPKNILKQIGLSSFEDINFNLVVQDGEIRLKPAIEKSPYAHLFEGYDLSKTRATFDWEG